MGMRSFVDVLLAALGNDAQAVVVEVFEAVGSALNGFRFATRICVMAAPQEDRLVTHSASISSLVPV